MTLGQPAGNAAAIAWKRQIGGDQVDIAELQAILQKQRVDITASLERVKKQAADSNMPSPQPARSVPFLNLGAPGDAPQADGQTVFVTSVVNTAACCAAILGCGGRGHVGDQSYRPRTVSPVRAKLSAHLASVGATSAG